METRLDTEPALGEGPESRAGVATLLSGILQDARHLFVQQMTLFQVEIKNDINRAIMAVIPLLTGALLALPAIFLLGVAAAFLLFAIAPDWPLWLCFGIIGGWVAGVACIFIIWGAIALNSVHGTPDTALKGLKENLQWKTKT